MNVLVTGGVGFIGTHVARRLMEMDHAVHVTDDLTATSGVRPEWLRRRVFFHGDLSVPAVAANAVAGMDAVVHLAAVEGNQHLLPEQAMAKNRLATAVLLRAAVQAGVQRFVTASSLSVYGEGLYQDRSGQVVPWHPPREQEAGTGWEPHDADGWPLRPMATPEWKPVEPGSPSALTKFDQERLTLLMGQSHAMSTLALRVASVFGPGQSDTGAIGRFSAAIAAGQAPQVHGDGRQTRDFIHVDDVARAFCLALEADVEGEAINVGSGAPRRILDVARDLARELEGADPVVTQEPCGARHRWADTQRAGQALRFRTVVPFKSAIRGMAGWFSAEARADRPSKERQVADEVVG